MLQARQSEATLYSWQAKLGGVEVTEAKRLTALEDENRKLKKLLAEAMLDRAALKELLAKNGSPARRCFRIGSVYSLVYRPRLVVHLLQWNGH